MVVKFYISIFILSTLFISCNEAVYFVSMDDSADDRPVIFDRRSIDFPKRNKKALRKSREKRKVKYQKPPKEGFILFDGQVEFIQLASTDVRPVDVSSKAAGIVSNENKEKENKQPISVTTTSKVKPPSDLQVKQESLIHHKEVRRLNTRKEKAEEKTDLPVVTQNRKTQYPVIPEWQPKLKINAPVKKNIPRPLDFLFVVDTSQSMHHHLIEFNRKFLFFLQYFSGLDWKLAMTNADHGDTGFFLLNLGALSGRAMSLERDGVELDLRYLHPGILGYNRIFLDSISKHETGTYLQHEGDEVKEVDQCDLPPYCQSYQEQPLKSLKSALSENRDFFRKEADLVAIVISNSKERANDQAAATNPEEVVEQFRKIHGEQKRFEVYGIIIAEGDEGCLKENFDQQFLFPEGAFSEKIADLSKMTGGEIFSICLPDYQLLAQSIFKSFFEGSE